jgi:hypothetical protein
MGRRDIAVAALTSLVAVLLSCSWGLNAIRAAAADKSAQLAKFVGCWVSSKAYGTISTSDAFKPDGYSLAEDFSAVSIEPIAGDAFTNVVKGTIDVWSDKGDYYIPTIYYGGVYDPIRDAILSDSTFYVVGDRLYFVHHRTTEKHADRALRILDRVDCSALQAKRAEAHRTYKPASSK